MHIQTVIICSNFQSNVHINFFAIYKKLSTTPLLIGPSLPLHSFNLKIFAKEKAVFRLDHVAKPLEKRYVPAKTQKLQKD